MFWSIVLLMQVSLFTLFRSGFPVYGPDNIFDKFFDGGERGGYHFGILEKLLGLSRRLLWLKFGFAIKRRCWFWFVPPFSGEISTLHGVVGRSGVILSRQATSAII